MPRPAKGIRLWLRPEERNSNGTLRKRAVWVIRDGSRKISTGCAAQDRADAERAVGGYLADKYQPNRTRGRHPSQIRLPTYWRSISKTLHLGTPARMRPSSVS
jgi:hypothetical protein